MITLTLLHPIQSVPVQSWSFEHESVIRIGRSTDNHVILYSAVVSRHHVELRQVGSKWEIVNLGANGTYLDGKRVTQVPVVDGVVIRLARSGPNIQIHMGASASGVSQGFSGDKTFGQRMAAKPDVAPPQAPVSAPPPEAAIPPLPATHQPDLDPGEEAVVPENLAIPPAIPSGNAPPVLEAVPPTPENALLPGDQLFCQDSGEPLQVLQTLVEYKIIKTLQEDEISLTQVAWRNGQSLLLRSLNSKWENHPEAVELFAQEAAALQQMSHPGIPRFVDFFQIQGRPYLAMEWVHGQDLRQWVQEKGAFALEEAIAILLQVCEVLDYLHQQTPPYTHQNIRPDHLVWRSSAFTTHNTIAVVGFPSFNLLEAELSSGLLSYQAPEQQQGQPVPQSDLYALGPTLIFLLTGKDPAEFYAQREQGYRLYPEYVPGLPNDVVSLIRKLTNSPLEERYSSATEVAEALSKLDESYE